MSNKCTQITNLIYKLWFTGQSAPWLYLYIYKSGFITISKLSLLRNSLKKHYQDTGSLTILCSHSQLIWSSNSCSPPLSLYSLPTVLLLTPLFFLTRPRFLTIVWVVVSQRGICPPLSSVKLSESDEKCFVVLGSCT